VLWPALGNHDIRSADPRTESGVYYDVFTVPTLGEAGGVPSGTRSYYSFDYANAHFICLNSEAADLSQSSAMLAWLRRDLAGNKRLWTIAYWHQPPYSRGSHDSDSDREQERHMGEMRRNFVPVLEAGGVDLVLGGHSHLYERSYLLHGHYGLSTSFHPSMLLDNGDGRIASRGAYHKVARGSEPAKGTVYVNAGSAGHASREKDLHGLNHPAMCVSLNIPGSVVVEIVGARLDAMFLDDRGVRLDHFTLLK
jgi:hypothetical protein